MAPRVESSKRQQAAQADLAAKRREYILPPPGWARSTLGSLLNDPRDEPVAYLFLNILTLAVPAGISLFFMPQSHILGAIYLTTNYVVFITRFLVALLHVTEHRRLFKPGDPQPELALDLPVDFCGLAFTFRSSAHGWQLMQPTEVCP
jgi:hypothetical protein